MTVSRPGAAVDVTVVLPCLNERDAVGLCVAQAIDAMKKAGLDNEVVMVDNGSTRRPGPASSTSSAVGTDGRCGPDSSRLAARSW